ncbi:MAG: pyrroloquinoline quinone biosynthesis protein PqqB [Alphaproteobacteria bacterium]|nr:pyrroloquinoline quinone biosynthesis protein PqqB [Alphaproteobacteria bacterium]
MRVIVLGSAAGGGFPQWNSNAPACRRARQGDPRVKPRTQASLAVSHDGAAWFLLNASPDIREQIAATEALWPKTGLRHSPIAGVLLTGGDVDAVAGLLTLRERHRFTVHATSEVQSVIAANSIFRVLSPECVEHRVLPLESPTALTLPDGSLSGLEVMAFTVPGKVALWLEDNGRDPGIVEGGHTIGLEVKEHATGKSLFFIPGCAAMTERLSQRLQGAALVFFDGTLWRDDEMVRLGIGPKTGQRMGHMSMSGASGTIAAFADLGVERKIFLHINNTNPVLVEDSPERAEAEAAGWTIAHDGLELTL